jgi:hypothetical protein
MTFQRASVILAFTLFALLPSAYAVKPTYAKGTFVEIQRKTRDKVDMYLVNTPVTTAVPYFQVSVELGDTNYTAEYTPRHAADELPEAWRVGEVVPARVEKRHLWLQRPDGIDMEWIVTKKSAIHKEESH